MKVREVCKGRLIDEGSDRSGRCEVGGRSTILDEDLSKEW